jgi:hypothetical protein
MADSFESFVLARLSQHQLSIRAYARLAGHSSGYSFFAAVLRGEEPPPLKQLDRWAAPLQLTEDERRLFDFLAAVAHAPPPVKAWFAAYDKPLLRPRRRRPGG